MDFSATSEESVILTREPPPAYSLNDPNDGNGRRREIRRRLSHMGIPSIMNRQRCSDPYRTQWPGCCRRCALSMLMDIVLLSIQYSITISSIISLSQRIGWQKCPTIVAGAICCTVVACLRFTTSVCKTLALIGKITQIFNIIMSICMHEIHLIHKDSFMENGTNESWALIEIVSVSCLCVSVASGTLPINYATDCLWCGPEQLWHGTAPMMLILTIIALVCNINISEWTRTRMMIAHVIMGLVCIIRDSATGITETCLFRHYRYKNMGTRNPLGSAFRRSGQMPSYENDISCLPLATHCICEILSIIVLIVSVLTLYAISCTLYYGNSPSQYSRCLLATLTGATMGSLIVLTIPIQRTGDTYSTRTKVVISIIVILGALAMLIIRIVGSALFCGSLSVLTSIVTTVLRKKCEHHERLAVACFAKCLIFLVILTCFSVGLVIWIIDKYTL